MTRTSLLALLLVVALPASAALFPVTAELPLTGAGADASSDDEAPALVTNTIDDHVLYLFSYSISADVERLTYAATTLDPTLALIEPLQLLTAGTGTFEGEAAGAFDPVNRVYLTVWAQDDSLAVGAAEVWGRTISADFANVSAPFRISEMGSADVDAAFDATAPAVAAQTDDGGFVVSWAGDDDVNGAGDGLFDVYARRVEANGTLQGTGRDRITSIGSSGGSATAPSIEYDDLAREFLVVYEARSAGRTYPDRIRGVRLTPTGARTPGEGEIAIDADLVVTSWPVRNPDLAYDDRGNRFLAVWDETRSPTDLTPVVWSRSIDLAGAPGNRQRVSDAPNGGTGVTWARDPQVVYSNFADGFVVAWSGDRRDVANGSVEALVREVDRDGVPRDEPQFASETTSPGAPGVEAVTPVLAASRASGIVSCTWSGAEVTPYRFSLQTRIYQLDQATSAPPASTPLRLSLAAAPNPFNPRTTLRYTIPQAGKTTLTIYDVRGQRVRTLVDGDVTAGIHRVEWDGTDGNGAGIGSGVYFARIEHASGVERRKLVLVK